MTIETDNEPATIKSTISESGFMVLSVAEATKMFPGLSRSQALERLKQHLKESQIKKPLKTSIKVK